MDRQYALETIGVLRPWDNVDGLFADYLRDAYREYFASQGRYKLQDVSQADPVLLKSKIPYAKLVEDPDVLQQLARSLRADSLIRTKVFKEGRHYRFSLDWLHSSKMDVLSSEVFTVDEPEPGQSIEPYDLTDQLHRAVDALVSKLPFNGHITGRDRDWVTVTMNRAVKLKKGDQLVVSTIDEVQKHPLLRTVVNWKMSEVGRLEVDEIDGPVVFCKILSEKAGRQIAKDQKISKVFPALETPVETSSDQTVQEEILRKQAEPPKLGWFAGGLMLGSYGRENSSLNSTSGYTGGGFLYGAQADVQLWMNRNIFTELGFGYGLYSFKQEVIQTGAATSAGSANGHTSRFNLDVGYSYLVTGEFYGPKFWGKLGYRNRSYSQAESQSEQTGKMSYGSFFLGLGGELPLREDVGAFLSLGVGLFNGSTESGFSVGSNNGASDFSFSVGGYYRLESRIRLNLGLDIQANSTDYSSGQSISHRVITFTPSIQYYF